MKEIERKNIPLQQEVYTTAYSILVIKMMLDSTTLFRRPEWLDSLMLMTYFLLIFVKLFLQDYEWKHIVGFLIVGSCCVYTCFSIQYFTILFTFTLIVASKYVDIKKTLNTTAMIKLFIIGLHVAYYIVIYQIAPETIDFSYRSGGAPRHYFFLGHANTFSAYLVWAMLELIYSVYDKIRTRHILLVWLIYLVFYQFTDSNTSLIICTLGCFLMTIDKVYPERMRNGIRRIARYSYMILAFFFTFLSAGYTSFSGGLMTFFTFLDNFFTGRLLYGAFLYDRFGPTMLGQAVYLPGSVVYWYGHWIDNIVIDNCFIMLLEYYGWVYLIILSICFLVIFQKKTILSVHEMIFMFVYVYFSVMENYATNVVICFPLIFIGRYLYRDKKEEQITVKKGK